MDTTPSLAARVDVLAAILREPVVRRCFRAASMSKDDEAETYVWERADLHSRRGAPFDFSRSSFTRDAGGAGPEDDEKRRKTETE